MGQSDWKMPLSWYLAMTGLRVAADQLADPAAGGSELPAENVNRLRALLPANHEADSGRLHDLEYRVTLVAPMKAGKSTLLNAMLSQDLLPARGPAMTVLPTRVAVDAGAARQRSALVISITSCCGCPGWPRSSPSLGAVKRSRPRCKRPRCCKMSPTPSPDGRRTTTPRWSSGGRPCASACPRSTTCSGWR